MRPVTGRRLQFIVYCTNMDCAMRIALYQPDIPQNTGTILRLGVCLGVPIDIIEPAGFSLSDKALKRAGLDYLTHLDMHRHESFAAFDTWRQQQGCRLVLLTTAAAQRYAEAAFAPTDILLLGRESVGVPREVHAQADLSVRIPMQPGMRSLNVAVAGAMVLGEALRQTGQLPVEAVRSGATD
ncbi:tRNA (cytidine(34)-2'-O)-methyltransferase [Candidatus Filomicrobium marinum]|uniref:tRNA (cytidine(34)-2'-O)-methyltransferase n=2 Tax=Hyphomicrobiaceae TaxID=45401 RepID=A0A0D6JG57_9HYPH|nr:tRNA (cytidine(34)-2'-O)-methyltransferase [Candidatus Filomicrobium marinum]CPR19999.1 tRNA (cytidine(34)-2'-O)-methyltransferase [Candidatus Filomicrobium marinum]